MKNSKKIRIAIASLAMASACAVTVLAAGYDSAQDPLVSLSYIESVVMPKIDTKINSLSSSVSSMQSKVDAVSGAAGEIDSLKNRITALENSSGSGLPDDAKARLEALERENSEQDERLSAAEAAIQAIADAGEDVYDDYSYQTVRVTGNGSVLSADGTADFILKSGSAEAYVSSGEVYDITGDVSLVNNAAVAAEHALTVRNAGVRITSDEAYFLVRGEYNIVEK